MATDGNNPLSTETGKLPPLEGLFHALVHEGRSVMMVSDDEDLLDACGQSVVRKLRQNPGVEVSAIFDMDREVLLQRFGRLVENLSVDQALKSVGPAPVQQVWLQHIHNSQELEQAKLLIRLSSDFPAAGVKLLLMSNNLCADDLIHHGQTKKLLVWHAPLMRHEAAPVAPSASKPLAAAATAAPHWMDDAAASPPVDFVFSNQKPSSPAVAKGQRWVVQLLLGVFVLVSVVVLGLHQWQASQTPDTPLAEVPVANPVNKADTKTDAVPLVQAPTPPVSDQPAVVDTPSTPTPTPTPEPSVVVPPVVADPPVNVIPAPVPKVAPAPLPGVAWVRQLKPGGWVVQHVALDSLKELQAWQAQYATLSRAQIVPLLRPDGQRYWVLVSGPFTSLERANAYAVSPGVPRNHWSRSVSSLQASLDDKP